MHLEPNLNKYDDILYGSGIETSDFLPVTSRQESWYFMVLRGSNKFGIDKMRYFSVK